MNIQCHGHCGILDEKGNVKNDETLEVLSKIALSYAKAGVDIVAPSDMMVRKSEKNIGSSFRKWI